MFKENIHIQLENLFKPKPLVLTLLGIHNEAAQTHSHSAT